MKLPWGQNRVSQKWISEKTRLLALVDLAWGLNSACQSTIHNTAENVLFYYMNLPWGQKIVSQKWISEKTRPLALVNLTWGLNSECQSTIHNTAENVLFYI